MPYPSLASAGAIEPMVGVCASPYRNDNGQGGGSLQSSETAGITVSRYNPSVMGTLGAPKLTPPQIE